jgi:hypothetical protein
VGLSAGGTFDPVRRRKQLVLAGLGLVLVVAACSSSGSNGSAGPATTEPPGHGIKLNQIQVIGTHNSYHIEQPADVLAGYATVEPDAPTLAYTHAPLDQQFESQGVRQIELDVHADPDGSLFRPIGTPGFKVFHTEQIDEKSTCETFTQCLDTVKTWSDAHQDAIPIMIHVEIKTGQEYPGPPDSLNMTPALYDALDAEARAVFPPDRLITPDDVRGTYPTLEAAVLAGNWPVLDDVRGRVMFTLDNNRDGYLAGHDSLAGRVAFTPSTPGQPDAAYLQENDPTGANLARIQDEVRRGYLIRTRADEPVTTPTSGDVTQRDDALVSGAHWISTDYPVPGMTARFGSTYVAMIPGGTPARCNPINAPEGCLSSWLESSPIPSGSGEGSTGTTG